MTSLKFASPSILYQDDHFVAINKPSGQLVHRSPLDPRATDFAIQAVRDATGKRVYAIHRLDRPTSGVLLFCFAPELVSSMQAQWQSGVVKRYRALVRGWLHSSGYIDYALKYQADKLAEADKKEGIFQSAATSYTCVKQFEAPFSTRRYSSARYSLVDLHLHSGRKHQLRRHLAHIRHPIIGDTTHGDGKQNSLARGHLGCTHLLLTCTQIQFWHPKIEKTIVISSPLSENFQACLQSLGSQSSKR